jgi:hypothetical protein
MESNDRKPEDATEGKPQGHVDIGILEVMEEQGIQLYDHDPEIAMLDRSGGMRKFYKSIEMACEAKKKRMDESPEAEDASAGEGSTRGLWKKASKKVGRSSLNSQSVGNPGRRGDRGNRPGESKARVSYSRGS